MLINIMLSEFLMLLILPFILSVLFTFLMCGIARYFKVEAHPNPLVKTHTQPTPYLGGVAVYLSVLIAFWSLGIFNNYYDFVIFAGLMMVLGVIDDIKPLSVLQKLAGQFVIIILSLYFVLNLHESIISLPQFCLQIIWLLVLTNALNLVDVMDGLATGIASIAFGGLCIVTIGQSLEFFNLASFIFFIALLGFLPFNFYKARIFLGDAGSLMIGFSFGLLILTETDYRENWHQILLLSLLLSVPLFELMFIFTMRYLSDNPIWKGSRDHFSLRLLSIGWKVPSILVTTYIFCLTAVLAVFLIRYNSPEIVKWGVLFIMCGIACFVWTKLAKIDIKS